MKPGGPIARASIGSTVHACCLSPPQPVAANLISTRITQRMEARPSNPSAALPFRAMANLLQAWPLLLGV